MMKSPSKDFFMDVEESTSSKDGFWDYGGNTFVTSHPNINPSSYSINESVFYGTDTNTAHPVNQAGESIHLKDTACKKQTARKSVARGSSNTVDNSEELNEDIKLEPNLDDDSANIAAKVLHFFCQKCKNGIRYSPNDLQKHFLICHNGESPLYPCEMCNYSASDFQEFKQHRKTHRSALVKCEICNNDYSYTLLGLTKHFSVAHCVNGHFSCSKCRFTTRDVGTFVQHIHRHNGIEYACQKCNHISYTKAEFQRHLHGHSAILPFSCQYCNYSAMRKDFIVRHVLAKHPEHVHSKDDPVIENANAQMTQANAGMTHVLKRNTPETQDKPLWRKDATEKAGENLERPNNFQFKSPGKEQTAKDFWVNVQSEQPSNDGPVTTINCSKEDANTQGSLGLLQNIVHGPTVLMVKNNKITVPANYSATFVGYKMVNGKQNLVIKLLPSNKQPTSTSQPSPQPSNSLPRSSHSTNHGSYGTSNNMNDNRLTPSFKPPSMPNLMSGTSVEKQSTSLQASPSTLGSLIARKNESISRMGSLDRQPSFESPHKNMHNFNTPTSSATGRKIKEEPEEYNINEQQFFDNDHNSEMSKDRMHSSMGSTSVSSNRFIDPTTGFLYSSQHRQSSGVTSSATMYSKDLNSSLLHSSTASGLGKYSCNTFPPRNAFGIRGVQYNDRFPRPMEMNKSDHAPFMPRITSVFSLQSRMPDPKPFGKNTYLHNILQDNKKVNEKLVLAKTSGTLISNSTSAYTKQPLSSPVQRFDNRIPNGNVPSAVFLKQEPDSSASGIRMSYPVRTSELMKSHSDSIVNQQLTKDRMGAVAKPAGPPAFHLVRTQVSGMPQANTLLYPPGSNRFALPVVRNNQPGVRMMTSQAISSNTATFSSPNRMNAPVMLNTKPGMVLTISNGPFGTIRNVTNASNGSSHVMNTVNNLARMGLPRIQHPSVPHMGSSQHNLSANIISGSSVGGKIPINLNVLQYCVNSDGSRTGGMEGNKQPQSMQKQPLYALLPDGKQAVLLNYVLPNSSSTANTQKNVQVNQVSRQLLPKKLEEMQQATLRKSDQMNTISASSVKEEDTSAFDGYGGNAATSVVNNPVCLQNKPTERKLCLRSNSSSTSVEEQMSPVSDDKSVSQPSMSSSNVPKPKSKQNILNPLSSKNKPCKRKASDSGSYEADFEFKTKKRVTEFYQEVPRKQTLHRKCKAKSYTSEVESPPEIPSPLPTPPQSPSPPPPAEPTKDIETTLRLFPVNDDQLVKYPHRDQPVVVLNHPDADVPEVINVMRTISKFNGHVLKVSLSKRTIEALLESGLLSSSDGRRSRRSKPVSPVKERFVLKLTLKKTSKNNYKIVKNTPTDKLQAKFNCWFCGRVFDNQDEWVGHGQRHLMEATKDWNTLF